MKHHPFTQHKAQCAVIKALPFAGQHAAHFASDRILRNQRFKHITDADGIDFLVSALRSQILRFLTDRHNQLTLCRLGQCIRHRQAGRQRCPCGTSPE